MLFAAFLNRFGLLRYLARFQPELIKQDADLVESMLANGDARSDKYPEAFSNFSYWSMPSEIEPLMASSGFEKIAIANAEGGTAYIDNGIKELDGALWDAWVDLNYQSAKEPELYGSSIHLVYVGQK